MSMLDLLPGRRKPTFSAATSHDAAAMVPIHAEAFHRGWSHGEFVELLENRDVVAHRAMMGEDLAGFILSRIVADEAEILSVAVAARWRGRGIAGELLHLHLRGLAGRGVATIFLEVGETNTPALRLYQHVGFRDVGRREGYYPDAGGRRIAALILRRDIA